MHKSIRIFGAIWLCALGINGAVFTEDQEHNVENIINKVLACRHIPGMTLSVIQNNDSWSRGFGLADIESGRHVHNSTVFQIGSLTKAMTMTLLGRLLQEKGYGWDTKLHTLPGGKIYEFPSEIPSRNVTLSDLLTHRTGLSGVVDNAIFCGYPDGTKTEDLARKIKLNPIVAGFREKYGYSNFLYMVLGYVTETLGGDSWENLVTSRVLEPIGMSETSIFFSDEDVLKANVAKPYIFKDDKFQPGTKGILKISPFESVGSAMSTGNDMLKWMRFNLNNGKTDNGKQLVDHEFLSKAYQDQFEFSQSLLDEMSYQTPTYPVDDITFGYGFAWFTGSYRGHRKVWHSGGMYSYVSYLWLYPEDSLGMFASVNGPGLPSISSRGMESIFWYITDLLLGYEPWIDSNTACTFEAPWVNKTAPRRQHNEIYKHTNMSSFIGTYVSDIFPEVKVSRDENSMSNGSLKFEMSRCKGLLYPEENDGVRFGFEMIEPWEWAIEQVRNENYTERFPVEFIMSKSNGTTENHVVGMNVTFMRNSVVGFVKLVQPEADDTTAAGLFLSKTLSEVLMLFAISYIGMI